MAEKNLDFDQVIERNGTDCLKYDFAVRRGMPEGILPLWVADMDFRISSYIQDDLVKQAEHGIYGYTDTQDEYYQAVNKWIRDQYGYRVLEEEIVKTPGVVYAIGMAIQAFTSPGEAVLIQQPVYYPFSDVIRKNGRKVISSDLVYDKDNQTYHIDMEDFERKIVENNVRLFLLCNPHNPVGRAWKKAELIQMGEILRKHEVIVFSDEIHADFVWNGNHQPFITAKEHFDQICVTATSPSKTFNLAGLQVSNLVIKNKILRRKFQLAIDASGYSQLNAAGLAACKAAYQFGKEWYEAVRKYIKSNIDFMDSYLKENIPQIKMIYPEATYLVWVDFGDLGLTDNQLEELVVKKANLWLDSGRIFGTAGKGFQRFNVACPRKILHQALKQLKKAVDDE